MMSWACGLRFMGINDLSRPYDARLISGVRAEVAQVSMTSFSASYSLLPQWHFFGGLSLSGSTGNCLLSAMIISPHCLQYQRGNGVPKYRCLLMHQSHCSPSTQCS